LFREWKKGGSREEYLAARRRARREVYRGKSESQKPLLDKLNTAEGRNEVFRLAKQMRGENRDVIGEQCVRNDEGRIVEGNDDIKEVWREHYSR